MASGYMTSDGKDLDARYLGINAKAASAKTVDSVSGSLVYNKIGVASNQAITFTISGTANNGNVTYKTPVDGYVTVYAKVDHGSSSYKIELKWGTVTLSEAEIPQYSAATKTYSAFFKAGEVFTLVYGGTHPSTTLTISGTVYPLAFYAK